MQVEFAGPGIVGRSQVIVNSYYPIVLVVAVQKIKILERLPVQHKEPDIRP